MSRPTFREWIDHPEDPPARPFYAAAVPLSMLGVTIGTPLWLLCITVPAVGTIVSYLWDTRNE
jgi:hypothetical protein